MSAEPSLSAPDPRLHATVVVPARDEASRIAACIRALSLQQGVTPESFEVIVVLDGCRDATASVAARAGLGAPALKLHLVELGEPQGVGRARRLGMDLACERLLSLGQEDGLIASTDADSVVAVDWLARQLALVAAGVEAIGGLIELDAREAEGLSERALADRERRREERLRDALLASPEDTVGHHQFSGASMALTARAYRACGGLPVRAALEDEALERELIARGVSIHRSAEVRVRTSARTDGRAPRGLARDLAQSDWRARRCYRSGEFPLERLLEAKQASVGLVLPAREVADTLGPIAAAAAGFQAAGLLDEVVVIDAASRDDTAQIAAAHGLPVLQEDDICSELGPALGKGDAMWRGLQCLNSEIVAFLDTDTIGFEPDFLTGLIGPLLCEPDVKLVKGAFRRPFRAGAATLADGGGRVTELMARPLLNLHAAELAVFDQPLAGETAARRELLEAIPFAAGYGVEIAMLIDAWRVVGIGALAQVDLGERQNSHQSLRELSAMAYAVLVAAESRFLGAEFADAFVCGSIALPSLDGSLRMEGRRVTVEERPPLRDRNPLRATAG